MTITGLPERLAFLQRAGERLTPLSGQSVTAPDPASRLEVTVTGVAREHRDDLGPVDPDTWLPGTGSVLSAMHTHGMPVTYTASHRHGRIRLRFGTWSVRPDTPPDGLAETIAGLLQSADLEVDVTGPTPPDPLRDVGVSAYLLGLPTVLVPTAGDRGGLLDRLIRATDTADWELTVIGRPISEDQTIAALEEALNEIRDIQEALEARRITAPLAEHHRRLTQALVDHLTTGVRRGCWRTAAYLTVPADQPGAFPLITGAVRGLANGNRSLPEAVRIVEDSTAGDLARWWGMADTAGRPGPAMVRRFYEYQTVLNSEQLAAYAHLPELETPGFTVRRYARFDSEPGPVPAGPTIDLGRIVTHDTPHAPAGELFTVGLDDLTRHAFVPGVTGAGKTNTILGLLTRVAPTAPFLVLEPAKTEYRVLTSLLPGVTVFTVGREAVAPLRLNPFEVIPYAPHQYDVAGHIDQLRSLFVACFGLWNPLPAVLERSLHRIYTDRGWDLRTGNNPRLNTASDPRLAFPVMTDLARAVDDVIADLGYDREVADNLRGALSVRVNALRLGAKGRMLDTRYGADADRLFTQPTVVELEGLGDEDDKAFLMGLLLIQLAAYRRAQGPQPHLQHLLVIEEAHRLLRNARQGAQEETNSAAKAVESFANLLSEVRAYGQGVIVADQVPVDLAPVVLKNTNLKIVHRLVAEDDREAVGATMVATPAQVQRLATLRPGLTAVFAEGQDSPLLVQIPKAPGNMQVSDADIAAIAEEPPADCPGLPDQRGACCPYADQVLTTAEFRSAYARLAVAGMIGGDIPWEFSDVADLIDAVTAPGITRDALERCTLGRAARWFADRRGAQYGWTYTQVTAMTTALQQLVGADPRTPRDATALAAYRDTALEVHTRVDDPFPNCYRICPDHTCVFRGAAMDLLRGPVHAEAWASAALDPTYAGDRTIPRWHAATGAGFEIAGLDCGEQIRSGRRSGNIRAALCFAQLATRTSNRLTPANQRQVMSALINTYGLDISKTADPERVQ